MVSRFSDTLILESPKWIGTYITFTVYSYLVRCLVGEVQRLLVAAPEEQLPCAGVLRVDCANMQGRVARCVAPVHVRAVEQQVV